ncbi:hypothetical protein TNCV_4518451 [Trichonephila clavipes]|nr:hypothetical protein TNCV_4518451 [Trichonephila clavipes]
MGLLPPVISIIAANSLCILTTRLPNVLEASVPFVTEQLFSILWKIPLCHHVAFQLIPYKFQWYLNQIRLLNLRISSTSEADENHSHVLSSNATPEPSH